MDTGESENSVTPPSRSRQNSKLKVLVRSHAFREETSPPRELLSPNTYNQQTAQQSAQQQQQQPRINLILSSTDGGRSPADVTSPVVVLSPTPSSRGLSPDAATIVPSSGSARCSPTSNGEDSATHDTEYQEHYHEISSPKYMNKLNNARNLDLPQKSSHNNSFRKKTQQQQYSCDCPNQICIKCTKAAETNLNNNNSTNVNNNNNNITVTTANNPNMLSVTRARGKMRQQSSSQGSFESSTNSPCLSRDSSSEQYTDTTGVDLEQFIPETLNRNAKDRALMLRIEQELVNLAKDRCKTHYKFPPMSSYQRMLVHRCAAYFGMEHNVEPTGKSVVVNKTKCTRIPEIEFKNYIREDAAFTEEPRRSILKRDSNSIEEYSFKSPDRSFSLENRRSKSFEEREEEYERARRRIFNRELHDGSEDFAWSAELPWSSTESDYSSSRFRLLPPDCQRRHLGKLIKVHSEDTGETLRPFVAKSYSFGGYGGNVSVLTRGDSVVSTHSAGPRLLTKQDSGASSVSWRLSPSSSGYKSQSQMSESVTPSPTSTPHPVSDNNTPSRQDSGVGDEDGSCAGGAAAAAATTTILRNTSGSVMKDDSHIIWAVTDMHNVPKGSIIINPQTGRPFQNDDGSIYHYDPNNIIAGLQLSMVKPASSSPQEPPSSQITTTNVSPKKTRSQKLSPSRKSHLTNSSTSPSLPFSPPPPPPSSTQQQPSSSSQTSTSSSHHQQRSCYSYGHSDSSSITSVHHQQQQQQQHFGGYAASYGTAPTATGTPEGSGAYQQPYIVFATSPYGVHVAQQYDARIDNSSIPDMGGASYYIQDASGQAQSQSIAYHQPVPPTPPYWNQAITYFPNGPHPSSATPPQRYSSAGSLPTPPQPGFFQPAYIPQVQPPPAPGHHHHHQQQAAPPPPPPPPPHPPNVPGEFIPLYTSNQPVQMIYQGQSMPPPPQPPGPNTVLYQGQPSAVIYAPHQGSVYPVPPSAVPYHPQQQMPLQMSVQSVSPYPQTTPTPNSCTSNTGPVFPVGGDPQTFLQLTQGMQCLNLGSQTPPQHGFVQNKCSFDFRNNRQPHFFSKNNNSNNFNNGKNKSNANSQQIMATVRSSSQSSTGTSSPAATVVPAAVNFNAYRTPPDTPPAQIFTPPFAPNYNMPPPHFGSFQYKPIGGMRAGTPGTSRSSRSPTPAGDITFYERQRMPLPVNMYQGISYVMPNDVRFSNAKRPPNMYRHYAPVNRTAFTEGSDNNRVNRNRKPKVNSKQQGLPPSGK